MERVFVRDWGRRWVGLDGLDWIGWMGWFLGERERDDCEIWYRYGWWKVGVYLTLP